MLAVKAEKKNKKKYIYKEFSNKHTCVTPADMYKKQRQFKCKSKYTSDYYTAQGAKNLKVKRKMAKNGDTELIATTENKKHVESTVRTKKRSTERERGRKIKQ